MLKLFEKETQLLRYDVTAETREDFVAEIRPETDGFTLQTQL